jgi:hypothetical protein
VAKKAKSVAKILLPAPSTPIPSEPDLPWWRAYVEELSEKDQRRFFDFGLTAFAELMRRNPDALANLPDDVKDKLQTAVMRRFRSQRKTKSGRSKELRPCPYCKLEFGGRELRAHKPRCPKAPQL